MSIRYDTLTLFLSLKPAFKIRTALNKIEQKMMNIKCINPYIYITKKQ